MQDLSNKCFVCGFPFDYTANNTPASCIYILIEIIFSTFPLETRERSFIVYMCILYSYETLFDSYTLCDIFLTNKRFRDGAV